MSLNILQGHNIKVDGCSVDCICNALISGNRTALEKFLREEILQLDFITISLVYSYF